MKLASWVEITGLLAVVTSLVFVGLEIRQNTQSSKAANQNALIEMAVSHQNTIMQDEELSRIFQSMLDGSESSLTSLQSFRASQIRANQVNIWESAYYAYDTNQLNDELWAAWDSFNKSLVNSDFRKWWNRHKVGFGASFSRYVDDILTYAP